MRITGGRARSRKLYVPKSDKIRLTSDRVRESLFNILPSMYETLFLDIFAGSGSVGIEALSRGSAGAAFIEKEALHARVLEKNLKLCGFGESGEVLILSAEHGIRMLSGRNQQFDTIFADPPYDRGLVTETLDMLGKYNVISKEGIVVMEHSFREAIAPREDFVLADQRRYGDTVLSFLQLRT
ncbi:MAG TPA: 16S rRNA (guanine(966)-N(2))-methyltransferase RsmD [Syntrophales bacterium]|nr:16S rRNA (guanine(966)-N(2))-methyltransferase RsmD [Syntrophales bacterium]HPQ44374.1 16S rRNA (guanine(966)-N(2))-methyltransferase RsmD [Syntrophales bacterium]